ncbi:hypothetical protein UlMin_016101 [Ulmus minor]
MLKKLLQKPSSLMTALGGRYRLLETPPALIRPMSSIFSSASRCSSDSQTTQCYELTRVSNLIEGCDYEHWLVVMEPPKGYPLHDEIVNGYITTLAIALGRNIAIYGKFLREEEAKKSFYSVSTKYYYAFGCKIPENFTPKIKCLPNVRWVLPDSYLCHDENEYGGEPFVDGAVLPYDEKYHAHWITDRTVECAPSYCIHSCAMESVS